MLARDWEHTELSGGHYERKTFLDVDLMELFNRGATFTECTLRGVQFRNASTRQEAVFLNCTFTRCKFFDATSTDCKMAGSMFDRCSYDLMEVVGVDLADAWSHSADLSGADLWGSDLSALDPLTVRLAGAVIEPDQAFVVASALGLKIR
ncbi:Pentapeptide repeat-containing protein [Streptoalloteichus hindustanus]|uniref:Pentapeptide repeat-containing protein n=1 Tax=Streptoalloteichus hindustanus TaxID=2017 RepID=A0A1M4ZF34_STRHI|nr:Pentapeptide repeat-containing protein [Streptoalloteichus hindustanus]